jgi:hypothetical protein
MPRPLRLLRSPVVRVGLLAGAVVLSEPLRPAQARPLVAQPPASQDVATIDWRLLAGLDYNTGKMSDTLKKLEGKRVRVPGFVVPLDDFQDEGAEFLLVPYYGACVHTPPPPPNQIVFVEMAGKKPVKLALFDAVWMEGRLKINTIESPYGAVGYQLEGMSVKPYGTK